MLITLLEIRQRKKGNLAIGEVADSFFEKLMYKAINKYK